MNTPDQTIIERSRKKLILAILGACVFVAMGIWMLSIDDASIRSIGRNPTIFHGLAIAGIAFFGLGGIRGLTWLFNRRPLLIFESAGIVDNVSGAGLIPWPEVVSAKIVRMRRQKFLLIEVKEPQKYLGRGNWILQVAAHARNKMYGSPIMISTIAMKTDIRELLSLFNQYQRKYGQM